MRRPLSLAALAILTAAAPGGCSGEPSPLSPTPGQDPERHARASVEMEATARRNREAEARFYRNLAATARVAPEADHDPGALTSTQDTRKNP